MNDLNEKKELRETQESNLQNTETVSDFDMEVDDKLDEYVDGLSPKGLLIMKEELSKIKEAKESDSRQKDLDSEIDNVIDEYTKDLTKEELVSLREAYRVRKEEQESGSSEGEEAPVKVMRFRGFAK